MKLTPEEREQRALQGRLYGVVKYTKNPYGDTTRQWWKLWMGSADSYY